MLDSASLKRPLDRGFHSLPVRMYCRTVYDCTRDRAPGTPHSCVLLCTGLCTGYFLELSTSKSVGKSSRVFSDLRCDLLLFCSSAMCTGVYCKRLSTLDSDKKPYITVLTHI